MIFKISKEVLIENLQKTLGPTLTKQNFPILNSILISTEGNKLKFTATDLDTTIITFQEADISEEGKIAVPMKRFFSIIRELPSQNILVEKKKNNLSIKCEKIEFKIALIDTEEFPKIEEKKKTSLIQINPEDLEEMIKLTSFCVGQEDANYVLGGILFEINEETIRLVATDGRRLAFIERKLPVNQSPVKKKNSFIIPLKAVNELYKLIKDRNSEVYLFLDENKVGFDLKETQFIARLIEGEFPNYEQYIPQESKNKLIVNREKMLFSLRRASLLSTQDYQGMKLELKKNEISISKITPQLGEVKEDLEVGYEGMSFEIGFNPVYIMDVLRNLEDQEVIFEFSGVDKPAVLRKENYIYLVLPMKI